MITGEEYNATTGTLSIPSMTVTTIFGCRGQNEAGNGPLVESHVGVKPSGITGFVSFLKLESTQYATPIYI